MITEKLFPIPKLYTSRRMIPLRKNNFRSLQIYLTFLTDLFDRYLTTRARGRRIKHVIRIFTGFTQLWNMILRWCNLRPKTPCNISAMLINAENTWSQFNICPGWISSELHHWSDIFVLYFLKIWHLLKNKYQLVELLWTSSILPAAIFLG